MFERMRMSWQAFRDEAPGQRFARRYARRRDRGVRAPLRRAAQLALGGVLVLVGLFFLVVPGPGLIPLLIGVALIAEESHAASRALDRLELRLRAWRRRA